MCDTIYRQDAIDAECEVCQIAPKRDRGHNCTYYVHGCKEIECIRALPSAQSEYTIEMQESDIDKVMKMMRDARVTILPSAQPETAKRIVGKSRDGMTLWYQCNMCNEPVDVQDNFCRGCGRKLIDE